MKEAEKEITKVEIRAEAAERELEKLLNKSS